ncbi:peptidase [Francisella tularensis subsp. tularensis MA00-2987]|nr:LD-carboxypeptidase LdcA [Francisella tularensis]EET18548.1 peptidase [Francisella tularensis subsp. tularensis MA00-2987]
MLLKNNYLVSIILVVLIMIVTKSFACAATDYNKVALINVSTQYYPNDIKQAEKALKDTGYNTTYKYLDIYPSDFGYSNPDSIRAKILLDALLDKNIDIIWFLKGGGGAFNLLPYLYDHINELKKAKPKILVGFSDVTAIHFFVNNVLGWKSLHGVVAAYNKNAYSSQKIGKIRINDLERIPNITEIINNGISYDKLMPMNKMAYNGIDGSIVGGNMTLIYSYFSTVYQQDISTKILFLEDTGISFRQLDRSLHQLLYLPENKKPEAIIFGQFYPLDPTDDQRLIYKTVIKKFAKTFNRPVYYFPFIGHGQYNKPLLLGVGSKKSYSIALYFAL